MKLCFLGTTGAWPCVGRSNQSQTEIVRRRQLYTKYAIIYYLYVCATLPIPDRAWTDSAGGHHSASSAAGTVVVVRSAPKAASRALITELASSGPPAAAIEPTDAGSNGIPSAE